MNCSPALKWIIVLMLPLTLVWKMSVASEDRYERTGEIIKFLVDQKLDVQASEQYSMQNIIMPNILEATSRSCRMLVANIEPDGSNETLIRNLATATDRVFIVFRGKVYDQRPSLLTVSYYVWTRILRELGIMRHTAFVVAVVATASCNAEQLPWDEFSERGAL